MRSSIIRRSFLSSFFGRGDERRGEFFVEGEEVFDAVAVGIEGLRAVAEVNGAVEVGMGFDQGGRHRQRVSVPHATANAFGISRLCALWGVIQLRRTGTGRSLGLQDGAQ